MRNSLYLPMALIFFAMLCMGLQCDKEYIEYKYNFVEKFDLLPSQKTYKTGDTIWIKYTNPSRRLFNKSTGESIVADTVFMEFQITLNSRYNAPLNPAGGYCDFVTSNGVNPSVYYSDYGTGILFSAGCNNNNNLDFTVGIVPKHTGIYSLDLLGTPRVVAGCLNRVSRFPRSLVEYRFNVADGNKDVYLSIPPQSRLESQKGYTENMIDNKQVYMVRVE